MNKLFNLKGNMSSTSQNSANITSHLFDETSFYKKFIQDLRNAQDEVIIESPFITTKRMDQLASIFEDLVHREVKVYVITRDPKEHNREYVDQSELAIQYFERLGIQVFIWKKNHHRKTAIIDRKILWEGSLNILSQSRSKEIMRRTESAEWANEMFKFLELNKVI